MLELYTNVVAELDNKINPLSLTELAGDIITQIKDAEEAIVFMEKLQPKVADNHEAKVLCNVLIAQIVLYRLEDQLRTKKFLKTQKRFWTKLMESLQFTESFTTCYRNCIARQETTLIIIELLFITSVV